jgi:hypothetical protein
MWKYHEYLKLKGARKIMDKGETEASEGRREVKQRRGKIIGKKKR